ncbi:hypothetical protein W262_02396 [Staphylococcus aureus DAR1961]|nr:hypothetical protein W262_02396 [Staphylococcus aureus DAR1961]
MQERERLIKVTHLQMKHQNLLGQIEAYDKTLKEIKYTRDLYNKHLSMNNEDAFAGLEMVEDEITEKLKKLLKISKQYQKKSISLTALNVMTKLLI